MNYSEKNQAILQKFVDREHLVGQYTIVEAMLGIDHPDFPTYEDIENNYSYGEIDGITFDQEEDLRELLSDVDNAIDDEIYPIKLDGYWAAPLSLSELEELKEEIEGKLSNGPEEKEISMWFLCSSHFYESARKVGVVVLECGSSHWWGREGGQFAVSDDEDIKKICFEMKILEGQENEWRVEL